ncbi:alpha/beta hydrolase [Paenibacillus sp. 598K]|uniref:alpha/beta hydrolase family protein n=1 Tax=Paenibacillus sp. 598K TaxID=1117987 RepID=UPI000FF94DF9|nr:alpha/beta fold hydrolase [Paenibacillus sp. 598K]GBF77785.1 alpha/beta hydrolase [Paenibacillus sp. 598K]
MERKIIWSLTAVVILTAALAAYVLDQHSYAMMERKVQIETAEGKLTGILALPEGREGRVGLVLFIHGDGPIDASHDDGYRPVWERLAARGYASLSLDKRGIGGSEGDWLAQTMDDRVEEARQALAWARQQPEIDPDRIGVWGASQAGWVIPKLAGAERLVFSILVSPAINWLTQGQYHTRSHLAGQGASETEIEQRLRDQAQVVELLREGASYETYVAKTPESEPMSRERWAFVQANYNSDATEDLAHFDTPVLLLLGEDDIHVDVRETEAVYRERVAQDLLTVELLPDTEHSMLQTSVADSWWRALAISLFAPRRITAAAYIERIDAFLTMLEQRDEPLAAGAHRSGRLR